MKLPYGGRATSKLMAQPMTSKRDAGRLQPRQQVVAHRLGGGDLAGGRRVVVEGQAERRLGQHLRGLGVAGVAAGDLGVDGAAVALGRRSRRVNHDFSRCASVGPSPCLIRLEQQVAHRRAPARRPRSRRRPATPPAAYAQGLGAGVVGVAEVRAVRRQRGAAAGHDERVDRRAAAAASSRAPCRGAACRRPRASDRPSRAAARRGVGPGVAVAHLPGAGERVERGVEGAAGEHAAGPDHAAHRDRPGSAPSCWTVK